MYVINFPEVAVVDESPQEEETRHTLLEASNDYKNGNITWDEYIHALLIRCCNTYPGTDFERRKLQDDDPFAYGVYGWSGRLKRKGVEMQGIRCPRRP